MGLVGVTGKLQPSGVWLLAALPLASFAISLAPASSSAHSSPGDPYHIDLIYFTPGAKSSSADVTERIERIESFTYRDDTNLTDEQIANFRNELELLRSGLRTASYYEPRSGKYPGAIGTAAMEVKMGQIDQLVGDTKSFYKLHTERELHIYVTSVIGQRSAMGYWLPQVTFGGGWTNVDTNPLPNNVKGELESRDLVPSASARRSGNSIYLVLVSGGGGLQQAQQNSGSWGGEALVGDITTACIAHRTKPYVTYRSKLPAHSPADIPCGYNAALGTLMHELGHALGLPDSDQAGCSGRDMDLLTSSQLNTEINSLGMFKASYSDSYAPVHGIMKEYDGEFCKPELDPRFDPSSPQYDPAARGYNRGNVSVPARPSAFYASECSILLDNPQLHKSATSPNYCPVFYSLPGRKQPPAPPARPPVKPPPREFSNFKLNLLPGTAKRAVLTRREINGYMREGFTGSMVDGRETVTSIVATIVNMTCAKHSRLGKLPCTHFGRTKIDQADANGVRAFTFKPTLSGRSRRGRARGGRGRRPLDRTVRRGNKLRIRLVVSLKGGKTKQFVYVIKVR